MAAPISEADIYRVEMTVRIRADKVRREAAIFDDSPERDLRAHASLLRQEADDLDRAADFIVGMQGCDLSVLLPMLRSGWDAQRAPHDRNKAAAAAAKAGDVAA